MVLSWNGPTRFCLLLWTPSPTPTNTATLHLLHSFWAFFSFYPVSDLQEEGKNAINAPMNPSTVDIHPEDTLLGKVFVAMEVVCERSHSGPHIIASLLNVDCPAGTERIGRDNWKRLHVICGLGIRKAKWSLKGSAKWGSLWTLSHVHPIPSLSPYERNSIILQQKVLKFIEINHFSLSWPYVSQSTELAEAS